MKPPGLLAAANRPMTSPSESIGHEHDRLGVHQLDHLLDEPGVGARAVADVGTAAAEVPPRPVLRADDVADAARDLVGQAVHGQRRGHVRVDGS